MTETEVLKFRKRALYVARKYGYPELADDFAGQIFVYFLEKPDRGATVDQLFIDFLRSTHGRPGTPGGDARITGAARTVSLDQNASGIEGADGPLLHELIGCVEHDPEPELADGRFAHCLRGREAEIYELYFVEEWSEATIGELLRLSESRVSQLLKPMKRKIQNFAGLQALRERLQWDEAFGQYSVDWITL